MTNARTALEQHHLLYDALSRPKWVHAIRGFLMDISAKSAVAEGIDHDAEAKGMVKTMRGTLEYAETFFVSREMGQVMMHASRGLDGLDQFTHELWPSDFGYLIFEEPWYTQDVWGHPLACQVLVWARTTDDGRPGTMLWHFVHVDDPKDFGNQHFNETNPKALDIVRAETGPWSLNHITWIGDGQRVGPPEQVLSDAGYERYVRLLEHAPDDVRSDPIYDLAQASLPADNPDRPVLALLMLLGQTIVSKERSDLKPRNPKHAKRMPLPGQVTVIKLRRETEGYVKPEGISDVEWHHRWLVRGHWRRQYCGPNHPLAVEVAPGQYRASIWVNGYIKGPEGAPFKVTEKVQALVR